MRYMQGRLRNTITHGHHRLLTSYAATPRQSYRCISSISTSGVRRGDLGRRIEWPAPCPALQLQVPTWNSRQISSAASAKLDDDVGESTFPEPLKADEGGADDISSDAEVLKEIQDAFAASETVPYFSCGFLVSSKRAGQELHNFLESNSQIATCYFNPVNYSFLKTLERRSNLRILKLHKRRIPEEHRSTDPLRLCILLIKSTGFTAPHESLRRTLEREAQEYLRCGIEDIDSHRRFFRYLRETMNREPEAVVTNAHSLILSACRKDITQIPTFAFLDKDGNHVNAPDRLQRDFRPYKVVFRRGNRSLQELRILHRSAIAGFNYTFAYAVVSWLEDHTSKSFRPKRGPAPGAVFTFDTNEWSPGEYLSRAGRALNYGYVTSEQRLMTPIIPGLLQDEEPQGVCETTIGMSDHRFESKTLWPTSKGSKKLAVLQACMAIRPQLEAAFKSGKMPADDYERFAKYWKAPEAPPLENFKVRDSSFSTALIDARSITRMVDVLKDLRELDQEIKVTEWQAIDEALYEPSATQGAYRMLGVLDMTRQPPRPHVMARMRAIKATLPISQSDYKEVIRKTVRDNDITIIKATTGSGKTTQVPQFLLDEVVERRHNIVCTQPRRIAAISVAKRVADERGQAIGDEVGFQVRFRDEPPSASSGINYMTAGYLLRLFEADHKWICNHYTHIIFDEVHERDIDTELLLTGMKNIMLHSPTAKLKLPKLILMSATIDADELKHYFNDAPDPPTVASIDVPGKVHPVTSTMLEDFWPRLLTKYPDAMGNPKQQPDMKEYLEAQLSTSKEEVAPPSDLDSDPTEDITESETGEETSAQLEPQREDKFIVPTPMLSHLIRDVLQESDSGDLLVFLPGLHEIDAVAEELNGKLASHHLVSRLHSTLGDSNFDAWEPGPPGSRRIFLSTNIAETSITLPNVTVVIDTGYSKQSDFDQSSQVESFSLRWISKAEVAQRRGRAGRTREGRYYATYSQKQYDSMADAQTPEMLRTDLTQIVLRTECSKAFKRPEGSELATPGRVLDLAPSPPKREDIEAAVQQLKHLHAFTADLKTTALGIMLSKFSVKPEPARMILMGILFRCLGPLILVAADNTENPLLHHPERVSNVAVARKEFAGKTFDDRLADAAAFISYAVADSKHNTEEKQRLERDKFMRSHSFSIMARHASQLLDGIMMMMDIPKRIGRNYDAVPVINSLFTASMAFPNLNSSSADLLKALILASSGQRVAKWDGKHWRNEKSLRVMPSPKSVNHDSLKRESKALNAIRREPGDLLCFSSLRKLPEGLGTAAWAIETSVVTPLSAFLFAESLRLGDDDVLIVNDWMKYRIEPQGEISYSPAEIAKIVLEFRKALDRFLVQAFADVCYAPARMAVVRSGEVRASKYNSFLRNSANPLRELWHKSILDILKFEKENKTVRKEARRAAAEADAPDDSNLKIFLQGLKGQV